MIRLILAVWLGKLIKALSQFLKIGGGSAAPGLYALKICPDLVSKLSSKIPQNVVITGTNGKTTTARLLNQLVKHQKIKTLRNSTGSNLERGVASSLIEASNLSADIKNVNLGIWELDEAAFNKVVFEIKPQIVVFLNVFRDQLDRYGEVDKVAKNWRESLSRIDWSPGILINCGDVYTWNLSSISEVNKNLNNIFGFRVKNHLLYQEKALKLKTKLSLDDFMAKVLKDSGLKGSRVELTYPGGIIKLDLPIPGIYNIYDLLAAFAVYYLLNLDINQNALQEGLNNFRPAFGRVENIKISSVESFIFLIKNPAGASAVFETVVPQIKKGDGLFMVLNDNFADGTDVSWIWDANFEEIQNSSRVKSRDCDIICSGTRAYDLAVRLKYAGVGVDQISVIQDLERALDQSLADLPGRLFIMSTYTALLELQKILAKRGHKKHYWKEEG